MPQVPAGIAWLLAINPSTMLVRSLEISSKIFLTRPLSSGTVVLMKKFGTQLPPDLVTRLHAYVRKNGAKVQTIVADALREYLARQNGSGKKETSK